MGDLYDTDVLEWSQHQNRLLGQHAAGEAGNEAPDWANIIEEVESVGRDQLYAVESLLAQALAHMLKAETVLHRSEMRPQLPYPRSGVRRCGHSSGVRDPAYD